MHIRCLRTCLCVPEFVCVCVDLFQDCHLFHACTDVTSFYTHLIHCQRTCVGSSCRHIRIPFLSVCLLAGMQNIATITPVQQNRTEATIRVRRTGQEASGRVSSETTSALCACGCRHGQGEKMLARVGSVDKIDNVSLSVNCSEKKLKDIETALYQILHRTTEHGTASSRPFFGSRANIWCLVSYVSWLVLSVSSAHGVMKPRSTLQWL